LLLLLLAVVTCK